MMNIERAAECYTAEYTTTKQLNGEEMNSQDIKKAYIAGAKDMLSAACEWATEKAQKSYLMTESDAEFVVYDMKRELE